MNLDKNACLLTIEWDAENEILEIHGNDEGLIKLRIALSSLISNTACDHVHLMTAEWGGNELSDEKWSSQNRLIHHVKIFKWTIQTENEPFPL